MIKEAHSWFIQNNSFILVPSTLPTLSGDLGFRSQVLFDSTNILNSSLNKLVYSNSNYNIYGPRNINYYIYLLNGSTANPIYTSTKISNTQLEFINFDLTQYSVGDNIILYNKTTLVEILSTTISNISGNIITLADSLINLPIPDRYKIINNNGAIYNIIENSENYKNLLNHKLKLGNKVYVNS